MIAQHLYKLATDDYRGFFAAILKSLLYLVSFLYGVLVRALIFLYRLSPCRLPCRVISVGNITLGGTGKTSLVFLIAAYLKGRGRKVAIITRGYKKKKSGMGDEPSMLKERLEDVPVIVDADRVRAAAKAVRDYAADTVIFDDGFQQWRIAKDLEIVALDAARPFGNRCLLPRGILREPLSSLKRADIFVLTKTDIYPVDPGIKAFLGNINPRVPVVESIHQPAGFLRFGQDRALLSVDTFRGKAALLFSGIGDPGSFEQLIRKLGIDVVLSLEFGDHHNYSSNDLGGISKAAAEKNADIVITTEKDAARITDLGLAWPGPSFYYLRVEIKLTENEERFYHRLLRLYPA